jgi:hypothetical protein
VVDPSFSESPYAAVGNSGAGYSPEANLDWYFLPATTAGAEKIVMRYYRGSRLYEGNVTVLKSWERDTRLEGPAMAITLVLALLSPLLARGRARRFSILLLVFVVVLIVGPILVVDYDYRYVIPAFGPLAAAAAIGGYELVRRAAAVARPRAQPG